MKEQVIFHECSCEVENKYGVLEFLSLNSDSIYVRFQERCLRVIATMEIRTKAVVFYEEGIRSAREIGETYNISERTVNFDQQYNYWCK